MIARARIPLLVAALAACSGGPGPARDSYARGVAALEEGDARTARIEFLNAIKADPASRAARIMQARTYLELRDGVAAEAEVRQARELGAPADVTAHLMAHALLLQGKAQEALDEAAQAAAAERAYAERIRGLAFEALGDDSAAGAAFERALAGDPGDSETWTEVARFRRANGALAGAIAAADKAVALDPGDADALVLRGELTRSQYGLAASMSWFDRAVELDPDHVGARLERAATLGDMGRTRAMLADTRAALALRPGNPTAYYLQSALAARAGNFGLARALYQRTEGKLDSNPATMLLAGAIAYRTGSLDQAVERLSTLVELQPDNARARRLLAAAQWRQGDAGGTIETLRRLVARRDADSYSLMLAARAHRKLGEEGAAREYLARAAEPSTTGSQLPLGESLSEGELANLRSAARSGNAEAEVLLIRALLASGGEDEALDRARRLQADNPGAPDAHLLAGDALFVAGRFANAANEYRKAANLSFTEPVALRTIEALDRSGQSAAAGQVLQLFLDQNPQNVAALTLAAGRFMQTRDWNRAISIYEGLRRRLGNGDSALLNNLAIAYGELGKHDRAIPLARHAYGLDTDNKATADTLGWLLVKSGRNRAEGLALLQRAARLS